MRHAPPLSTPPMQETPITVGESLYPVGKCGGSFQYGALAPIALPYRPVDDITRTRDLHRKKRTIREGAHLSLPRGGPFVGGLLASVLYHSALTGKRVVGDAPTINTRPAVRGIMAKRSSSRLLPSSAKREAQTSHLTSDFTQSPRKKSS